MKKFRHISGEHQLCYAHGVTCNLAVCDVLYATPTSVKEETENEDAEEDDIDANCFLDFDLPEAAPLAPEFSEVVKMVRKLLTYFRRSPVRNVTFG